MSNGVPATVDDLKPGVHYALGTRRVYRPMPADFRETFLRLGWDREIEEHYRTNWRCIRRWIEEAGGDELRADRAAVSGGFVRPGQRSGLRAYAEVHQQR